MSTYLTETRKTKLDKELADWLDKRAEAEGRNISMMIRVLLREAKLREEETALA